MQDMQIWGNYTYHSDIRLKPEQKNKGKEKAWFHGFPAGRIYLTTFNPTLASSVCFGHINIFTELKKYHQSMKPLQMMNTIICKREFKIIDWLYLDSIQSPTIQKKKPPPHYLCKFFCLFTIRFLCGSLASSALNLSVLTPPALLILPKSPREHLKWLLLKGQKGWEKY